MGDRTRLEVVVYSCPPESVSRVLEVFEEFTLDNEYVMPGDPAPDPATPARLPSLELGRAYIDSEALVGTSSEVAQALPKDAAWKVWEDPAFQHLGEVHLNHPDLGVFVSDCDVQGRPVFNSGEIDSLVEVTGGDRVQMGHRTGRTWEMALERLSAANNGLVIPRDSGPASAPLQAAALNQVASGPSRWLPPERTQIGPVVGAPDR